MAASKRRNGSGSVFQRADGLWVAQVSGWDEHAGKVVKHRKYAKTRDAARDALRQLRESAPTPARLDPHMGAGDYLTMWVRDVLPSETHHGRPLAENTRKMYADVIRWVAVPAMGKVRMSHLDADQARAWQARVSAATTKAGSPLSPSTVRIAHTAVTRARDHAVKAGMLDVNPLRGLSRPRIEDRKGVRSMTSQEVDLALAAVRGRRVETLTIVVAYTGMRVGEALALTWGDIGADTILVRGTKSSAAFRSVPLLPEPAAALRSWKAAQAREKLLLGAGWSAGDLVFTTGDGKPQGASHARRDLVRALRKANLPTSRPFHSFRHSMATRLINRGVPLAVVSKIIGHSSIQVTADIYGHIEPAITAEAMASVLGRSV